MQLYVIISDDTVQILKMEYLHAFFIFIISVSKAVVFAVREISAKKPSPLTQFEWERHVHGHNLDD